ncbi:MAG: arginine--tRNA ligase, partial [Spirochaetota bacterium]|nr:arginine--tRNA ligase [Spirochaetota bacterium]
MEHIYKKIIAGLIKKEISQDESELFELVTTPPKKDMGDFAFPCFSLAKLLKKSPQAIAGEIAGKLPAHEAFSKVEAAGPYVNFYLNKTLFVKTILEGVLNWDEKEFQSLGKGKTIVMDFSSPNIAKPFSIAHLRSTSIGNSLSNIFEYLGYKVVRINHLGDWGTSFGKLIVAYRKWGEASELEESPIRKLLDLYVRFHKEADSSPELEEEAKSWFKRLEDGDEEAVKLWKWFKELSLSEFNRMYDKLGVRFDHYWGESFYQDKIDSVMEEISKGGLLSESQGATIVNLDSFDMPPVLLKKQDGATLYATRDIAAAMYRWKEFSFDEMIYVVGGEQDLHFKQFFKVLELMGHSWVERCQHIGFGLIQFKSGKMSTREGKIIFLEEVIEKGRELALDKINESEAEKENEDKVSDEEKSERALALG